MRRSLLAAVGLLCLGSYVPAVPAQEVHGAVVPIEPGYATGHVTCSDTQRPARLAEVRFVPVPMAGKGAPVQDAPKSKMSELNTNQMFGAEINPVQTDLEGAFTVRNLKPGRYVVRVDLRGYLTPLLNFAPVDFGHPDEGAWQRMSRELQIVEIRSRTETRVDVSPQRGATIGGVVRFDDGSPAIGIATELKVRNAKGEWEDTHLSGFGFGGTDGRGQYQIDGVPPGSYMVRANLSFNEYTNSVMPINGNEVHMQMTKTIFSLPVYTGSVLREREVTPIKVEGGSNYDGNDITVPISKLHHVGGTVLGGDGHPVNSGRIVLRYADDDSEVASVSISREERAFQFPYVPEGSYTLAVEDARDVTEVEVANTQGVVPRTRIEEKTVRRYGKVEQPLVVQSDLEGVLVTVPDFKTGSGVAGAPASE